MLETVGNVKQEKSLALCFGLLCREIAFSIGTHYVATCTFKVVVPTGLEPVTKELCYTTIVFTTTIQRIFRLATYRLDNICGLDYAFTLE